MESSDAETERDIVLSLMGQLESQLESQSGPVSSSFPEEDLPSAEEMWRLVEIIKQANVAQRRNADE